jgi:hypothetical protein
MLAQLVAQLGTSRAVLEDAVAAVPIELRQQRPSLSQWSVAEVLACGANR